MTTQKEKIEAARKLGVCNFTPMQSRALHWIACEAVKRPEHRDTLTVSRIASRFKIGKAASVYLMRPSLYW